MRGSIIIVFQVKNEEAQIKEAIISARLLSKNIVVMDMHSSDKTREISRKNGAKVLAIPDSAYVEPVRNLAFELTDSDWVLILDADERLTKELAHEIKTVLQNQKDQFTHFSLPRLNIFAGKIKFKHGGWWPDYQIRLIKRSAFVNWPKNIHSTVQVSGKQGKLNNPFLHYFHGDLSLMVEKTEKFEDIEADLLLKANRNVKINTFFRKYFGELYRRLLKHRGWADGSYGTIESLYQAYSKTITWLFLYEKKFIKKL
jgi:glycosyltransferase involved in cell wall biosynthesis